MITIKNTIARHLGFSLTEILITLSLFFILAGVGMGAYFQYYKFSLITNEVMAVQNLIRNTRFKALKNTGASDYGVHIDAQNNRLTVFQAPYSAGASANIVLDLDQLTISGVMLLPNPGNTNEIIFQTSTGKTVNTGSFIIGNDSYQYPFTINSQGGIE